MTVSELIEKLREMPQDARVIMPVEATGKWDQEVRDVIYNDPSHVRGKDAGTVELDNWPAEGF